MAPTAPARAHIVAKGCVTGNLLRAIVANYCLDRSVGCSVARPVAIQKPFISIAERIMKLYSKSIVVVGVVAVAIAAVGVVVGVVVIVVIGRPDC